MAQPKINNSYSLDVLRLLPNVPVTAKAEKYLKGLKTGKLAERKQLGGIDTIVALLGIQKGHYIILVTGHVSLETNVNRQPGGRSGVFRYENLIAGFGNPIICIHSIKIRRSCEPNSIIKHTMSMTDSLNFYLTATKNIQRHHEVTLPFESDWINSPIPLKCATHHKCMEECPFEMQRMKLAQVMISRERESKIVEGYREHLDASNPSLDTEDQQIIRFIVTKATIATAPLDKEHMWREYIKWGGTKLNIETVRMRFFSHLVHKIYESTKYDLEKKVRIFFAMGVPINSDFLQKIRNHSEVEVDEKQRIIEYTSRSGLLKLRGTHNSSSNLNVSHNGKRRWDYPGKCSQQAITLNRSNVEMDANNERTLKIPKIVHFQETGAKQESSVTGKTQYEVQCVNGISSVHSSQKNINVPVSLFANDLTTKSATTFLKILSNFIFLLDSPVFLELLEGIEQHIGLLKDQDKRIPIEIIDATIKLALMMITKKSNCVEDGEKWHLKEILKLFKTAVVLRLGVGAELLELIKLTILEANFGDENIKVSIIRIKNVVETVIKIVLP